jgi:hypothetical protein
MPVVLTEGCGLRRATCDTQLLAVDLFHMVDVWFVLRVAPTCTAGRGCCVLAARHQSYTTYDGVQYTCMSGIVHDYWGTVQGRAGACLGVRTGL